MHVLRMIGILLMMPKSRQGRRLKLLPAKIRRSGLPWGSASRKCPYKAKHSFKSDTRNIAVVFPVHTRNSVFLISHTKEVSDYLYLLVNEQHRFSLFLVFIIWSGKQNGGSADGKKTCKIQGVCVSPAQMLTCFNTLFSSHKKGPPS